MATDKLLAFMASFRGIRIRSLHGLGGECVDLVQVWAAILGRAAIPGNAVDLFGNASRKEWSAVPNGPENHPNPGDIVVWRASPAAGIGPLGHTGVAIQAGRLWLHTFDQNWPTGEPAGYVDHSYLGCVGWLSPR